MSRASGNESCFADPTKPVPLLSKIVACALGSLAFTLGAAGQAQVPPAPGEPPQPQPPAPPNPSTPPPAAPAWGSPPAPQADAPAAPGARPPEAGEEALPWRRTTLSWDQSATTETVGIGRDTQSLNPTYDWAFTLKPRYYVWEQGDVQAVSIRGAIGLTREFTNSDSTTDRGEWSLTDAELTAAYGVRVNDYPDYHTTLLVRAPVLSFPTSTFSANNGKILGTGVTLSAFQQLPVFGHEERSFETLCGATRGCVNATLGYDHTFTDSTEPTNDQLGNVRMDVLGRSVPTNQLSGIAFAEHVMIIETGAELAITERIVWANTFGWQLAWKYRFDEGNETQVCNLPTGCVTPERPENPSNYAVVTTFASEVGVKVFDDLSLAAGYNNVSAQLGADGTRRSFFYSPYSRVYLTVTASLDEIYKTATGKRDKSGNQRRASLGTAVVASAEHEKTAY